MRSDPCPLGRPKRCPNPNEHTKEKENGGAHLFPGSVPKFPLSGFRLGKGRLFLSPRGRGGQEKRTGVGRGKQFIVGIAVARRGSGRGFARRPYQLKGKGLNRFPPAPVLSETSVHTQCEHSRGNRGQVGSRSIVSR